jgi:hypothetical protein
MTPVQTIPVDNRFLWALGINNVAHDTPIKPDSGLFLLVKDVVFALERISKISDISLRVKNLPGVSAGPAFARLENQQQ